ncbi:MAG TPA: hypothetical protein VFS43_01035 [Polyangiaceae bacterium]|nr:hypothetical protein [Polyangiaceae bacterium]
MADAKGAGAGPARPSNYQIEKGLKHSLESTDAGLKQFLESMRASGMASAPQAYRAMQMVLIQQRLWADAHHRAQLQPLFRSIAQTAGELHRIFAGFADVMKPLKELDKLGKAALERAARGEAAPGDATEPPAGGGAGP